MKASHWRRSALGRYLRHLPRIKHIRGTWLHRRLGDRLFAPELWQPDRQRFAAGTAVGAFFAMMPVPFQMPAAALIAYVTRVNIPAAVAFTWITNPLTAAFFLYIQYKMGVFCLGHRMLKNPDMSVMELLTRAPLPLLVGAFITGAIGALVSYPLALWGWDYVTKHFLHPRKPVNPTAPGKNME